MLKTTFGNYHINFSNSDFSVDIALICFKFLGYIPYSPPEGKVSQNFDLGPGYFCMLCRPKFKKKETRFPQEERYEDIPQVS